MAKDAPTGNRISHPIGVGVVKFYEWLYAESQGMPVAVSIHAMATHFGVARKTVRQYITWLVERNLMKRTEQRCPVSYTKVVVVWAQASPERVRSAMSVSKTLNFKSNLHLDTRVPQPKAPRPPKPKPLPEPEPAVIFVTDLGISL